MEKAVRDGRCRQNGGQVVAVGSRHERRERMYRQYEDPRALEKRLKELKEEYKVLSEQGADEDTLVSMSMDIEELEERVNFAWQDEEHDEEY